MRKISKINEPIILNWRLKLAKEEQLTHYCSKCFYELSLDDPFNILK